MQIEGYCRQFDERIKMEGVKPLFIVKPGSMSRADIRRAEKQAFICVVECDAPDAVRFLEPPPNAGLDVQARAALSLMRFVTNGVGPFQRGELLKWFVDAILNYKNPPASVEKVLPVPKAKG
jgi:hypothetical protein